MIFNNYLAKSHEVSPDTLYLADETIGQVG